MMPTTRSASLRLTLLRSMGMRRGLIVGIEEDVEAGELADGHIDVLGVFDGVQGDGFVGEGLESERGRDAANLA